MNGNRIAILWTRNNFMSTTAPYVYLSLLSLALSGCNGPNQRSSSYSSSPSPSTSSGTQPVLGAGAIAATDQPTVNNQDSTSTRSLSANASPNQRGEVFPATPSPVAGSEPQTLKTIIPGGTDLRVRLEETIDTKRNRPGDRFSASLIAPVTVDGHVSVPAGTRFQGHLSEAQRSGRLKGRAVISLELDSMQLNGATYDLNTRADTKVSGRHRKRNLVLIGGGAGVGALIGGLAAGPVAALAGAGAGAGAGTVGAFFTGRKDVRLPVETPLNFRVRQDVSSRDVSLK
jgi:hypothetical protein